MKNAILHFETPDGRKLSAFESPCVIGRSPRCSVHLPLPEVSRRHAVIIREGRNWWLADCGSRAGTWLNDTRLTKATKLSNGDIIGLGVASLRFTPGEILMDPTGPGTCLMETTRPGDLEWLVTSGTSVLWVDRDHMITSISAEAAGWIAAFFEGIAGNHLPESLANWLASEGGSHLPYEKRVGDERLRVNACHEENGALLLVLSRLKPAFGHESLQRIGLSRAEANLVPWLIRGKRNDEIATIVGVAPKTVEKQVANILSKLKVETRTAAAWSIIEHTGAHW